MDLVRKIGKILLLISVLASLTQGRNFEAEKNWQLRLRLEFFKCNGAALKISDSMFQTMKNCLNKVASGSKNKEIETGSPLLSTKEHDAMFICVVEGLGLMNVTAGKVHKENVMDLLLKVMPSNPVSTIQEIVAALTTCADNNESSLKLSGDSGEDRRKYREFIQCTARKVMKVCGDSHYLDEQSAEPDRS